MTIGTVLAPGDEVWRATHDGDGEASSSGASQAVTEVLQADGEAEVPTDTAGASVLSWAARDAPLARGGVGGAVTVPDGLGVVATDEAIAYSAVRTAASLDAAMILAFTEFGTTAVGVAR